MITTQHKLVEQWTTEGSGAAHNIRRGYECRLTVGRFVVELEKGLKCEQRVTDFTAGSNVLIGVNFRDPM